MKCIMVALMCALALCPCHGQTSHRHARSTLDDRQRAILTRLRDQINLTYGFIKGSPRINNGPCGRFAKEFREQWNARFGDQINIAFVMSPDGTFCYHVLVIFARSRRC